LCCSAAHAAAPPATRCWLPWRRCAGTQALAALQVWVISLDPQHDTAERLRAHLAPFDPAFIGASADANTLQRLVDDLALSAAPAGALVLVGPDAVLRAEYLPPYDARLLAADFLMVRSRR
jgi:protein SCO1